MATSLNKIKILVVGPPQAGKTAVANFVAERSDVINPNYHPTVACRILEFEKESPKHPKRPA